jgi:hypothetical protein
MRYLLFAACLFGGQFASAQQSLPDSTMKEFTRLTCECVTLMKIDQSVTDKAIDDLGTCINTTIGVFESKGWIRKEWLDDSEWAQHFDSEMQAGLVSSCPVFKALLEKVNNPVDIPGPLPTVNERYFLSGEFMNKKGMIADTNATTVNMRRWSALHLNEAKIQMVFDIRFVFKNEPDAISYYLANLEDLSEGGEPTASTIDSFGASESRVYGANARMLEAIGNLDMAQYNFVFRVKNVVAKVFVAASKKATYDEALVFAREAISRIRSAQ